MIHDTFCAQQDTLQKCLNLLGMKLDTIQHSMIL